MESRHDGRKLHEVAWQEDRSRRGPFPSRKRGSMTPPNQTLIVALKLPDGSYKLLSIAEKRTVA